MNFLAHAWLAAGEPALRVGGLAGDFVKGPLPAGLPADLAQGVALHRAIDSFSDRHPAFLRSRARVGAERRRYSGVLVDMFYDHLLACRWPAYSPQPLADFAGETYALACARLDELPEGFRPVFESMRRHDWLAAYGGREALSRSFARMAEYRARRPNPLTNAEEELFADFGGYEQDFHEFLPDALAFASAWRGAAGGAP